MESPRLLFVLLIASASALSGCTTTVTIPRSELIRLNGFDAHNEFDVAIPVHHATANGGVHTGTSNVTQSTFRLISDDGTAVTFTSKTPLTLHLDRKSITERYRKISVGERFSGRPMQSNRAEVDLLLSDIDEATVSVPSRGKTLGLMIGLGTGVPLVLGGLILALAL